jgi:hypothetical protein
LAVPIAKARISAAQEKNDYAITLLTEATGKPDSIH